MGTLALRAVIAISISGLKPLLAELLTCPGFANASPGNAAVVKPKADCCRN